MATLADVAKLAHVSKMTVSRVLNHPEQVSETVKQEVTAAIDALGYQPNVKAKALVTQQNYIMRFVVLEDVATVEPNYAILLLQLADLLRGAGYTLEITREIAATDHVDGLIVTGWRQKDIPALEALTVPVMLYGRAPAASSLSFIDIDNQAGTTLATQTLLDEGYEHIYFVGLASDMPFAKDRKRGYEEVMQRAKRPVHILSVANHSHAAAKAIDDIGELRPNTGFVVATDRMALGVIRALQAQQKAIPTDFGIIGFDGIFIDQLSSPLLSTVQQPLADIARALVDGLLTLRQTKERQEMFVAPKLKYRGTTRQ